MAIILFSAILSTITTCGLYVFFPGTARPTPKHRKH